MLPEALPEYIRYLLKAGCNDQAENRVELIQTHISYVMLIGDYVYKWKKPVDLGFLDFTSLEKRKYYCEEEVRLNRRLCPDIYLGVVTLTRDRVHYAINGSGEVVEYGVKMVRLPEDKMMNRSISLGLLNDSHITRIVNLLVPFYKQAIIGGRENTFGHRETIAKTVYENFLQTERFVGGAALSSRCFADIRSYSENFLNQKDIFVKRVEKGRVRECHGDLHSGNICLTEKIQIFDCIEFNSSLRFTDVAADIAFLAMDLDYHGLHELSELFVKSFIERTKDDDLRLMLNFYACYRAYVRGKISLLTANDPCVNPTDAALALEAAKKYFELARNYGGGS